MSYKLKCPNCGHEKLITKDFLEKHNIDSIKNISKLMPRFLCSICQTKGARIITAAIIEQEGFKPTGNSRISHSSRPSSTALIPGLTINYRSGQLGQTSPKNLSPSKWNKKTCHFCNGTGANGNCFNCCGTGWEEAEY